MQSYEYLSGFVEYNGVSGVYRVPESGLVIRMIGEDNPIVILLPQRTDEYWILPEGIHASRSQDHRQEDGFAVLVYPKGYTLEVREIIIWVPTMPRDIIPRLNTYAEETLQKISNP